MGVRWVALLAIVSATPLAAQETVTRVVPADPDVSLRIFNLAGSTHIMGWDGDSVRVRATLPKGAGRFFIGGAHAGIKLGVEAEERLDAPGAQLEIAVPRRARVWVKAASARITVEGVTGELDLASVSGDIRVSGAPRVITAESMDGTIEVQGDVAITRVKTADGPIRISGPGGDLTVSSVSGAILVRASRDIISARIESVTGRVTLEGPVSQEGNVDIQTHEAPITLALPGNQGATLDIVAFSGKVMNGFPDARRTASPGQPVRYVLRDGGARMTVRSLKGGITVRRLDRASSNAP
ncbi:MAG TPA: DUF4097 family beta strand repeat-containing protein [Gemmatimonadales bacterium]|jgi:hypothetical protein|nr:DUF4097 family beta strand repeat-containing protein [Gemmatimonadales bacterium]